MRAGAALLTAALAGTVALGGCGRTDNSVNEAGLDGPTWQIVALYTDPATPGDLPADAAGRASLAFGSRSMHGQTGCAPLQAKVTSQVTVLHLDEVEIDDPGDCTGGSRHVHDQLAALLTPGTEFDVRRLGDSEAVLTRRGGEIDAPAIRIMAP